MIEKTYPITEKLLEKGLSLSQQFFETLTQESQNLKQKTATETMTALTEQKKSIVQQLEQFTQQLTQVLATEKLPYDQNGVQQYFAIANKAGLFKENHLQQWLEISRLAKQCRQVNEQNGAGIALLMRHNQRALQILRGKPQTAAVYSADGSTQSAHTSHTLISV